MSVQLNTGVEKMRIAVDAFGGDNAPCEIVKGAVMAVNKFDCEVVLVGDEKTITALLENETYKKEKITVKHASEVVENDDSATLSVRRKKDSSMVVALSLVKDGLADAVVSAGNTGAYLTAAFMVLGRIDGIKRPALAPCMPNKNGMSVIIDSGANVDCKPEYLVQFAYMGSIYSENVLGVKSPRVGLVNIGVEEKKGNALVKETYALLKEEKGINFIGNVEAREVPKGEADVLVCDGFSGNIVIKLIEGVAITLFDMLKSVFYKSIITKIAAMILKPGLKEVKKSMDASEYGGAPLLGVNGAVIKAHGNSDAKSIHNAIKSAMLFAETKVNDKIREFLNSSADEKIEN